MIAGGSERLEVEKVEDEDRLGLVWLKMLDTLY